MVRKAEEGGGLPLFLRKKGQQSTKNANKKEGTTS